MIAAVIGAVAPELVSNAAAIDAPSVALLADPIGCREKKA